jgi:hypothetical protein
LRGHRQRSGIAIDANVMSSDERLSAALGVYVLNEVVLNQITVGFGEEEPGEHGDRMTMEIVRRIQADNICYAAEARWRDRTILRLSVCSMATRNADIDLLRRCAGRMESSAKRMNVASGQYCGLPVGDFHFSGGAAASVDEPELANRVAAMGKAAGPPWAAVLAWS